jgi:hypothetical protein
MSKFDTDLQRIFLQRVKVETWDLKYAERGDHFVRFRDDKTGKLYEVKIKEKK